MPSPDSWPSSLLLVRHGESAGNVASDAAEAAGRLRIDIDQRDMDVDLSGLGLRQAKALGGWLADLGDGAPTVALASPYERARHTAELALETAGLDIGLVLDERLREREFGVLDRVTLLGIEKLFPDQAAARAHLGKFYHRPPGGESWVDVGLRVRNVLDSVSREHAGERVMIVAHQVVILMFRYVIERLTEQEVMAISCQDEMANCAVTTFEYRPDAGPRGGLRMKHCNEEMTMPDADTAAGAPTDRRPDA